MGDTCCSAGLVRFVAKLKTLRPGIFVHAVMVGANAKQDRIHSFLDSIDRQIVEVAEQLAAVPELQDGFNAIGFSQGGQFLRAYVQRFNAPPVHNLITLGSQHQGTVEGS